MSDPDRPVILATWGTVAVGDIIVPAPGAEWEVTALELDASVRAGEVTATIRRGDVEHVRDVPLAQAVKILDRVTMAARRDGVPVEDVAAGVVTSAGLEPERVEHAGANGACPDYGNRLDPCPPGCASGTCVAAGEKTVAPPGETAQVRAQILHMCQVCGALTYPAKRQLHAEWHDRANVEYRP